MIVFMTFIILIILLLVIIISYEAALVTQRMLR